MLLLQQIEKIMTPFHGRLKQMEILRSRMENTTRSSFLRYQYLSKILNFNGWQAVSFYTTALEQNAANGTNPKHTLLSNRSASFCALKKYDKALEDAVSCISCNPSFPKVHQLFSAHSMFHWFDSS
jgi:hypothetical protein